MKLYANQRTKHLSDGLKSSYLLVGDEPLQLQEATDAIRAKAKQEGFSEREPHQVDGSFQWHELQNSAGNMSLFAAKRIIELHMPTGKPGRSGSAALVGFVENTLVKTK